MKLIPKWQVFVHVDGLHPIDWSLWDAKMVDWENDECSCYYRFPKHAPVIHHSMEAVRDAEDIVIADIISPQRRFGVRQLYAIDRRLETIDRSRMERPQAMGWRTIP